MFRPASRTLLRSAQSSLAPARTIAGRRCISTEAPHLRSRTWKSSAARWGIAIAGIYYYNTSPVFAEQPGSNLLNPNVDALEDHDSSSSLDSLVSKKQSQRNKSVLSSAADAPSTTLPTPSDLSDPSDPAESPLSSDPSALESEAGQQGAFNEETGEINWDCPCLGGMAHGPCGPEFREAFSCFVFSKEEPKGMDCIEKFKGMQECFQQHPEVYKGELEEDEELEAEVEKERQQLAQQIAQRDASERNDAPDVTERRLLEEAGSAPAKPSSVTSQSTTVTQSEKKPQSEAEMQPSSEPHPGMSEEHESISEGQSLPVTRTPSPSPVKEKFNEDLELMPKDWHDARTTGGEKSKDPER